MRKLLLICFLIIMSLFSFAQSWNPYVNQGIISQLLPGEFNSAGEASFIIGNTGSSPLVCDSVNPDNNLSLVINFANGVPGTKNPLAALGGSWVDMFGWSYDASTQSFTAVQITTIPGYDQGTITIKYKVTSNSSLVNASNGFSVTLQPPAYAKVSNTTQDDAISSYTFTQAYDYGDAPKSYGKAKHKIDMSKDPESGLYTKYIVLGALVDQESESKYSATADGDDNSGSDDEDGVTFPPLIAGNIVTIPVVVTTHGLSYGILFAWIDWNGDGDFTDVGEKVSGTPLAVFKSGTYNLSVAIPDTAITTHPTFARFRIGANGGPTAENAWGEVEDYQVSIQNLNLQVITTQVNVQRYGDSTGSIDVTVRGGKMPYKYLWGNGEKTQNISNLVAGTYSVTVTDDANNSVTTTVAITQTKGSLPVEGKGLNGINLNGNKTKKD
jgi:hypothetical protein